MSSAEAGESRGLLLSALSGALLALAYPRPGFGALAFAALVPLLLALADASPAAALRRGYVAGIVFFSILLRWLVAVMVSFGGLPWPAAVLFLALLVAYLATYVALFAGALARLWRRAGPLALLAAPVLWVGFEILRGRLLTGFPWGLLGYSQAWNLPLLQVASLGGIYAVSFLVVAVNAGLALLLARPGARGLAAALGLLLVPAAAHLWGRAALRAFDRPAAAPTVRVAAVQGNVPQDRKWEPGEEVRIVRDLLDLTRQAAAGGARIVVWPEASSPFTFRRPRRDDAAPGGPPAIEPYREYADLVSGLARDLGVTLIAGSVDYRLEGGRLVALNSAFAVAPDGTIGPSYDKVHLVPFGEYVPLRRLLFFVNRMVQGAIAEFAPGRRLEPLPTPAGPAGTLICYEAIFPELARRLARDASFLVNITNDAWFGTSAAPQQHLDMAVVRAVENRIDLVRAANTGISAIVDPGGRILGRTRMDERTVLWGDLGPRPAPPLYARAGDAFAWGCAIVILLLVAAPRAAFSRSGSRAPAPEPTADAAHPGHR